MKNSRSHDVALLCNPQAGGRWRVLADVLDSEEAKSVSRIVTDEIDDVREALAALGQRVKLLCIYGGDGTVYRVINELLRDPTYTPPRLAILGGGTMNVTASWCGMRRSPGENFRQVMRAYLADRPLWREVPLVALKQNEQTLYGFTFALGPLVRILEKYETGKKTHANALAIAFKSALGAIGKAPKEFQSILQELEAEVTVDGQRLPATRFAAVLANVTGKVNPFVEPFHGERTRDTFHFLAYAVSSREFAMMTPLLMRAKLPIDPKSLLHPVSAWRQALLSLVGGQGGLPIDPRYANYPAKKVVIETDEPHFTLDGEVLPSRDRRFELSLGPQLHLATFAARRKKLKPQKSAVAEADTEHASEEENHDP